MNHTVDQVKTPQSSKFEQRGPLYTAFAYTTWPALFTICMAITAYGFANDQTILFFNIAYIFLIMSMIALEHFMPHERKWKYNDGQIFADIAHTLSSKGTVQLLLLFGGVIGLAEYMRPIDDLTSPGFWPREWPIWAQVCIGVVAAEFGLYWAHRLAHERRPLWRLHAIHHSVTKLWFVNTGRFHVLDSVFKITLSLSILIVMGAPMEVVKWVSAVTAFIGMMTHCNIDMRFGPLNYVFNTPELHRWHHSKDLREGDKNYGENVIIWDLLFGTYYNGNYRPPVDIGIPEYMPKKFLYQIAWPFLTDKNREQLEPDYYTYTPAPKTQAPKTWRNLWGIIYKGD